MSACGTGVQGPVLVEFDMGCPNGTGIPTKGSGHLVCDLELTLGQRRNSDDLGSSRPKGYPGQLVQTGARNSKEGPEHLVSDFVSNIFVLCSAVDDWGRGWGLIFFSFPSAFKGCSGVSQNLKHPLRKVFREIPQGKPLKGLGVDPATVPNTNKTVIGRKVRGGHPQIPNNQKEHNAHVINSP